MLRKYMEKKVYIFKVLLEKSKNRYFKAAILSYSLIFFKFYLFNSNSSILLFYENRNYSIIIYYFLGTFQFKTLNKSV